MTPLRAFVFLTVIFTVIGSTHRYVWARLIRDPGFSPRVTRALTALLVVLALAPVAAMFATRLDAGRDVVGPLSSIAMTWLGTLLYVVLALGVADLVRVVGVKMLSAPLDESRRRVFARFSAGVVALVAGGIGLGGVAKLSAGPVVKRIRVPLTKLSRGHDGYRIVQLTDVHVGPTLGREFVEKLVHDVNALSADMVVITGDLVDGSVLALTEHVAPLARIRARDGVFFVTGNHEYYSGADEWIAHLATLGIRTLRNERVPIGGETGFDLAGVDDFRAAQFGGDHGPDLARALAGRDETRALVLLAHQPKQAPGAATSGVDLQLSGHTHAGQIRPFDMLVRLEQPFIHGLYALGAMTLYVSPGTGYWGPPMRVGTTSEITEITLAAIA